MRRRKEYLPSDFDIGDLVRLSEDHKLEVGLGVIADIKENLEDVYDLVYLRAKIEKYHSLVEIDNDIFPSTPQILVLWNTRDIIRNNVSLWMYAEELTILQKVIKDTK
jgi:hypothetical protein